jgi:hypothetical protein
MVRLIGCAEQSEAHLWSLFFGGWQTEPENLFAAEFWSLHDDFIQTSKTKLL